MFAYILRKILGTRNERELKKIEPLVDQINALEPTVQPLSDTELTGKTDEFKNRLAQGETVDDLLCEAFAVVREASVRTLGMRHFDSQLIGGVVLHQGRITEMKTGEGKTLVATLPVYLNALGGKGVHVVTVNDYLATRDSAWMGKLYKFLGLTVGCIVHGLTEEERKTAYGSDITYGTNNEFGFDYLRDNMKFRLDDYVQRDFHYAIVDEVDSILIDEARTPLIISGPTEDSTDKYYKIDKIIPRLKKDEDYTIDEKTNSAALTEEGNEKVEQLLGMGNLYDPSNIELVHHVNQALKAHTLFKRDTDYVVKENEVLIVDEFTGRLMPGRRYSDGLHQALEAKEGVKIEKENQTLATVTFQNFFRMYDKLAGMTGTADTEAEEFNKIYSLEVIVIPTNKPMIREDASDLIYKTGKEKFKAVVNEIEDCHRRGQPVLVGTISIENSEKLSAMLKRKGISHNVLNAKQHDREAEIVAQAGRFQAVTIATNMAGRGTDIVLGGNPEFLAHAKAAEGSEKYESLVEHFSRQCTEERDQVLEAGGLHILGTERHESRRIDNQLRGRSGRQGDPGSSRFYLALDDDLLRIFGSDRISSVMDRLGIEEDVPIENRMVTRAIENAQKKVEAQNFNIRKQLLEYDNVMNQQREAIYSLRREILQGEDTKEMILEMVDDLLQRYLSTYLAEEKTGETWDLDGLGDFYHRIFNLGLPYEGGEISGMAFDELKEKLKTHIANTYYQKELDFGESFIRHVEQMVLLQSLDAQWKDHLLGMDALKEGIGLRGYGQRDPLLEYKKEGFNMFQDSLERIDENSITTLFHIQIERPEEVELARARQRQEMHLSHGQSGGGATKAKTVVKGEKIGRNAPCPCGSGKKYKKCCGQ
ncbi:MAG: preprotein translocase subunit SecA [bacterium]|nr:preprotein translocase subunit SecA [bacterium]